MRHDAGYTRVVRAEFSIRQETRYCRKGGGDYTVDIVTHTCGKTAATTYRPCDCRKCENGWPGNHESILDGMACDSCRVAFGAIDRQCQGD